MEGKFNIKSVMLGFPAAVKSAEPITSTGTD
jgi:hypothetical protein